MKVQKRKNIRTGLLLLRVAFLASHFGGIQSEIASLERENALKKILEYNKLLLLP